MANIDLTLSVDGNAINKSVEINTVEDIYRLLWEIRDVIKPVLNGGK